MLTISTIPEALAELEKQTGRAWTDSELFDVATARNIELHAAVPRTAKVIVQEYVKGEGFKIKFPGMPIREGGWALLYPWQVKELWVGGETFVNSPNDRNDTEREGEYILFAEPVRVTREQIRIGCETLRNIVNIWRSAQAGRWVEDKSYPKGMRHQRGPDWMFPQLSEENSHTNSEAVKGIEKQRVIAAFEDLHFNGARWGKTLGAPPKWLKPCRVIQGNKTTSSLWNPVQIAVALYDKGISIKKLDAVFVHLKDWADEWQAASEYLRE